MALRTARAPACPDRDSSRDGSATPARVRAIVTLTAWPTASATTRTTGTASATAGEGAADTDPDSVDNFRDRDMHGEGRAAGQRGGHELAAGQERGRGGNELG